MSAEELRCDVALVRHGLAASRERARALIEGGCVFMNGFPVNKASQKVTACDTIEVRGDVCPYVSRGGFKLERALTVFGVDPSGCVALDVGASTGGFTDVLLQRGARSIYAVDVGTAQLDPKLLADPRVVSMEQTNARTLCREMFPEVPTLAVMDVSFISIIKILPALRVVLGTNGRVVSLVKPQFEAGISVQSKKGVISSPSVHERVLKELAFNLPTTGWQLRALTFSPVKGAQGNLEFLADLSPLPADFLPPDAAAIRALVREAHEYFRKR